MKSSYTFYPASTAKIFLGYTLLCPLIGSIVINLYRHIEMIVRLMLVSNEKFVWQILNPINDILLNYLLFFWLVYLTPSLIIGATLAKKKYYALFQTQPIRLFLLGVIITVFWFFMLKILMSNGTFHYYFDTANLGKIYAIFVNAVVMGVSAMILGKFILPKGEI